ncbi:DUF3383 domain-containing protein [Klebsiella pneumoniae]|uniref:DUF3383 domain-containing protein n=1 Tax=Klebsiella pneumoniae TaxID=573 RepID=UPI001F4B3C7A|nr:DUF3383 domain-containing protein [Klebsiella pneumoniae]HBW3346583.1 DUF3383 domain-containing protein [Klebsiella pneumoniae]
MSIPASQLAGVIPGVLSAGGSAVDMNGLFLTDNAYAPFGQVLSFASSDDVGTYFGSDSTEHSLAKIYFKGYEDCTQYPGKIMFSLWPTSAISARLFGGSLASVTLNDLKLFTGTFSISVDGSTVNADNMDFSGVSSFSDAAAIISNTIGGISAVYDSTKSGFILTSQSSGEKSTISAATGTLADSLMLSASMGAVTSQGSQPLTPGAMMDSVVKIAPNWGVFTTVIEPPLEDKLAFSAWANDSRYEYAYVGWDTDVAAKQSNASGTFGAQVRAAAYNGTLPLWGSVNTAAFALGIAASLDFNRRNGRATFAFRTQGGLASEVDDGTVASNLLANGYSYYGVYANKTNSWNILYNGAVSGSFTWMDCYINQIWLNDNLQLAMLNLLMSVGSIPYETNGYTMVEAACMDPIEAALNFGAIRTGTTLSNSQKAQIKQAVGSDVSSTIISKGYYLQIDEATPEIRAKRASPTMTLYYSDGGSIQQLSLASIMIQ